MKRVLVVGATGLLGRSIVKVLGETAEVVEASRSGSSEIVDITDPRSIEHLFGRIGEVDAVICVAGMAPFLPWSDATDGDWGIGISSKLMGQVNLVRIGAPFVRDGGALILTTGVLAEHPIPGSCIVTTVNSAVDGFVRAAAIEVGRGVRVNAVSPGWITETMEAMGMDSSAGLPAAEVASVYARLLDEDVTGCSVVAAKGM